MEYKLIPYNYICPYSENYLGEAMCNYCWLYSVNHYTLFSFCNFNKRHRKSCFTLTLNNYSWQLYFRCLFEGLEISPRFGKVCSWFKVALDQDSSYFNEGLHENHLARPNDLFPLFTWVSLSICCFSGLNYYTSIR